MFETIRSFFAPPISPEVAQGTAKLTWIVRLRWIALLAQLGTIYPALHFELLEPDKLPGFMSVIALLAVLNTATWLWLRSGGVASQALVLFQLGTDALALSMMLALTGGAWNPVAPLLFVHAVLGSLLLEGRLSIYFFGMLLTCLIFIQGFAYIPTGLRGTLVPPEILFPAQLLFAVVFWILTAWLSRTLTSMQSHFLTLRERKTRIDRLRAVGALAAGLSHEFATPLNTAQLKLRRLAREHGLENSSDVATASEALDRCGEVLRHMAGSQLQPEGLSLEESDIDNLVEQPVSSIMNDFPCFASYLDLSEAAQSSTWLGAHGADSPKCIKVWNTGEWFPNVCKPKPPADDNAVRLCVKSGRWVTGTSSLGDSECYPCGLGSDVAAEWWEANDM